MARRITYSRGIWVMALVILPSTLLAWSIVIWGDPEESSTLSKSIANNALPLYAFSIFPSMLISTLHTKILIAAQNGSDINLYLRSVATGTLLGLVLAGILSVMLFQTLNPTLWPLWAWGGGMGLLYGALRLWIER